MIGAMRNAILLLAALSLGACATPAPFGVAELTPEQCDASWGGVGFADGEDGAALSKLARYRDACARAGAPLSPGDEAAWRDGWRGGLGRFCAAPATAKEDMAAQDRLCPRVIAANDAIDEAASGGVGDPDFDPDYGDETRRTDSRDDGVYDGPRIIPRVGIGVGVGSGGVRVGGGVGIGVGIFNLGLGF